MEFRHSSWQSGVEDWICQKHGKVSALPAEDLVLSTQETNGVSKAADGNFLFLLPTQKSRCEFKLVGTGYF